MKNFKKIAALILALILVLSMVACAGDEKGDEAAGGSESKVPADAFATVNWDKAKGYVIGAELCEDDTVLRMYFQYTNLAEVPDSGYNSIRVEATQNEVELEETYAEEDEETEELAANSILAVQQNYTIRYALSYELEDESKVSVKLYDYDEEEKDVTFEIDLAKLPGKPTSEFEMKKLADPKRTANAPSKSEYNMDFEISIDDVEVFEEDGDKIARVYYTFTNNSSDAENMGFVTTIAVYQDGVELREAFPSNGVDSDDNFDGDTAAGETNKVSVCYLLRSDSPIEVEFYEFDDIVLGKRFDVK